MDWEKFREASRLAEKEVADVAEAGAGQTAAKQELADAKAVVQQKEDRVKEATEAIEEQTVEAIAALQTLRAQLDAQIDLLQGSPSVPMTPSAPATTPPQAGPESAAA